MPFAIRGVIEGFYGRPWSWDERDRMVDFMAANGLNLYCYAPKNDPIHRNRWREPYLPEEVDRLVALARRCEALGIEFVFGLTPLVFHYTSETDLETVLFKFNQVYTHGIRSFCLLVDDMPNHFHFPSDGERFGTLGHAHAWLVNTVLERLPGAKLYFCPTEYHGTGVSDYLRTLGAEMHPGAEIFWTGPEVCSAHLATADARRVSETVQRPILYWDNYPVNDGEMHFDPHLRPMRGRDRDLHTACKGIVINGALEAEGSKVAIHTYAQYFSDPHGYEPEAAWLPALQAVTGDPEDAEAVRILGDLSRRSVMDRGRGLANAFVPKLCRFWHLWGGSPADAGPDLPDLPAAQAPASDLTPDRDAAIAFMAGELAALRRAAERLNGGLKNQHLQRELTPWATKFIGWVDVAERGLEILRRIRADRDDPALPALRTDLISRIVDVRQNFYWVGGDLFDQFARRCCWAAAGGGK